MLNEFAFYAAVSGALVYGFTGFLTKDKGLSWLITGLVGLAVITFVFPEPQHATNLGDIAGNLQRLLQMGIYVVGWTIGSFLLSMVWPRSRA